MLSGLHGQISLTLFPGSLRAREEPGSEAKFSHAPQMKSLPSPETYFSPTLTIVL